MDRSSARRRRRLGSLGGVVLLAAIVTAVIAAGATQAGSAAPTKVKPKFTDAAAFDTSKPLRELVKSAKTVKANALPAERGPTVADRGHSADGAPQRALPPTTIPAPLLTFEGLSNQDNFNIYGGRVNPPDPVGDVGPNHYVEMVNLAFAVYDKLGTRLLGPVPLGALWDGFPIDECTEASGDPIVIHDQFADRWILTQFTTRGLGFPDEPLNPFYNCVAISTTSDPTGSYYRYAFTTGFNFPDYPKYGVWRGSYLLTTREFGVADPSIYGIGVYALERSKMLRGNPNARAVSFLLKEGEVPINLIGDGLLPPDIDGRRLPDDGSTAPLIGTQDDEGPYGATFDALNIWELLVEWQREPQASLDLATQLPVAEFDSAFPCRPGPRDCLAQPGITDRLQYLDILSYRQRPTWRLAYRKFNDYETLVTNQSVEALQKRAGVRWYEVRRADNAVYSVHQQGTFGLFDADRWMGSIAMDKKGNMALGYSIVNDTTVFPGIRYTGRLSGDPLGQMTLGEGVIINGTGVQTTTNSRWGDYTSMNIDPVDDCTFWYVNEYYTLAGQQSSPAGWQTRIASFRLPGC